MPVPQPYEHLSVHRVSLKRLDQEFYTHRNSAGNTEHAAVAHVHPLEERPINPVAYVPDTTNTRLSAASTAEVAIGEAKHVDVDERKYADTKPDTKLADELTAAGGAGALADAAADEKPLVEQQSAVLASKEKEEQLQKPQAWDPAFVPSATVMDMDNLTYDRVEEPTEVAAVSVSLPDSMSKEEAAPSPKEEEEEVPVPMPVAEPVDHRLKEDLHPELIDKEDRVEEERAAAVSAVGSGASVAALESVLIEQAVDAHSQERSEVLLPVAEPVNPALAAPSDEPTLHAPHPSLSLDGAFPLEEATFSDAPPLQTVDLLRAQEAAEKAEVEREAERLDGAAELTDEQREEAQMQLMNRTHRLAALHEKIIQQETAAASPVDPATARRSPALQAAAPSSRFAEIQQLHLAQQAASAETHTAVERQAPPKVGKGLVNERMRQMEQKIKEETDAKKQQDDLFAGQYMKGSNVAGSSPSGGSGKKAKKEWK